MGRASLLSSDTCSCWYDAFLPGQPTRRKGCRTVQSESQSPMITAATANRSIVFEPNDLLLLAAYEAVGKESVEEEEESGGGRAKCIPVV